ncbi:adenosine deaminase [Aeromicrobium chenweiae]|uniref:Adenosine deaminase n=1 Tax=Aeromicrobium chenweiae TaxID=2079793 RepID=A0A2S0WHK4_9ACTN|nr:adenosine deaminase [Aeromicrobium chenweiae]AWB90808.1 adenosine deaminase [Aeromicrobium chenweiae]TGN31071.1 adenosine deaminase [Aeromicrobium chenweiae]
MSFETGLPKAELHVHHVGSASMRTVAELAERHAGSTTVPTDPQKLAEFFTFTDFAHFIEVYLSVVDLLRTPEDLWTLTYDVARDLTAQNVRYVELTCTPYTSIAVGISAEAYCEALEDARRRAEADFGLTMRWIFDIPGESGLPAADVTLDTALRLQPDGLVGFGLGGPEIGVPRPQFKPHFDQARAAGLHSLPHAGESTGPQTIWDSLEALGAERIGHGIAAAQDPALMAYLAEHQIPLEISPTSNIRTRSVPSMDAHPLPTLVAAGVPVSINSDDPPMFSTTISHEYEVARDLLGLDDAGVADLARAGVRQSYAPDAVKTRLLAEIDAYAIS